MKKSLNIRLTYGAMRFAYWRPTFTFLWANIHWANENHGFPPSDYPVNDYDPPAGWQSHV